MKLWIQRITASACLSASCAVASSASHGEQVAQLCRAFRLCFQGVQWPERVMWVAWFSMAHLEAGSDAERLMTQLYECARTAKDRKQLLEGFDGVCRTFAQNREAPWRVLQTVKDTDGSTYRYRYRVLRMYSWNGRHRQEWCPTQRGEFGDWWKDEYIVQDEPCMAEVWGPQVVWLDTARRVSWSFSLDRRTCSVSDVRQYPPPVWLKLNTAFEMVRAAVAWEAVPLHEWLRMKIGPARASDDGVWEGVKVTDEQLRRLAEKGVESGCWSVQYRPGLVVVERRGTSGRTEVCIIMDQEHVEKVYWMSVHDPGTGRVVGARAWGFDHGGRVGWLVEGEPKLARSGVGWEAGGAPEVVMLRFARLEYACEVDTRLFELSLSDFETGTSDIEGVRKVYNKGVEVQGVRTLAGSNEPAAMERRRKVMRWMIVAWMGASLLIAAYRVKGRQKAGCILM